MVRVRFAPSPTGYLHIGSLRTALYNELFARHNGGTLILRIEDTDRTRYVEGAVEDILRTLEWAGIVIDEGPVLSESGELTEKGDYGPYFQSLRLNTYLKHVEKLLASGHAYRCFCTPERLDEMRHQQQNAGRPIMYDRHCREHMSPEDVSLALKEGQGYVVRLKVPGGGQVEFEDEVRGKVSFPSETIDDQVLLKSDGFPTYHLANVVDDHLMEISHVIRGEEWLPSTPKHVLLYQAFGWEPPRFAHLPLLLNSDRSKLSKRQGDVAVGDYRAKGYLPEALTNFVALLGFNPKADQEVYTKEELIEHFDLGRVNKGGAVFNREKLDWLNREHIKKLSDQELAQLAQEYFADLPGFEAKGPIYERAIHLERTRASVLADLAEGSQFYFAEDYPLEADKIPWKTSTPQVAAGRLRMLRERLAGLDEAVFNDLSGLKHELMDLVTAHKDDGWTNADTLWPMRFALTGKAASPSPAEVAWAIGKPKTVSRLERAIKMLSDED